VDFNKIRLSFLKIVEEGSCLNSLKGKQVLDFDQPYDELEFKSSEHDDNQSKREARMIDSSSSYKRNWNRNWS
jgi:hypothetical protein